MSEKNKLSGDILNEEWLEIAAMTDFVTQYGSGASLTDIKLQDLYRYLQNPYSHIKQIQKSSKYLTNKHGVIKEVLRAFKSLPTLDYILSWSDFDDPKKLKKYERKLHDFLNEIDIKSVVRDGLYEVAEMGTIVTCLRNNKYVQFLDLDDLRINRQRNGKWVVEYDLQSIKAYKTYQDKLAIIESLPPEITVEKYNLFENKGEDYRYVEIKNCDVINIDAHRNFPFGLPITLGAWSSLLQKEVINRVERSIADRLIKQIVILKAGYIDKNGEKLVPKEAIQAYFNEIKKILMQKDGLSNKSPQDASGTGLISLLQGLELDTLDVNTEMFKKELYEKIDNDIYMNLGVSSSLIYGGGDSDYSSAQLNSQKFFRYVYTVLEKFENLINSYIKLLLPANLSCTFKFSKTTMLDKDKHIDQLKELYMQTGMSKLWIETLSGLPYEDVINQIRYEREILNTEDILRPPLNAYTQSGKVDNKAGREQVDNPTNPNTIKSKSQGSNNVPKPSTQ